MKFRINSKKFNSAVVAAADVALKNIRKYENNEAFCYAKMLTIEASSTTLNIRAFGGLASITVKVRDTEGYICEESGVITVEAKELVDAVKTFSPMSNLSVCVDDSQLKIILESGKRVLVELPTIDINIECPPLPRKFVHEATVDRAIFLRGMKKVVWAMAKEEKMFTYMCTLFECWTNRMGFSAGSGGRFVNFDINNCPSKIAGEHAKILFPRQSTSNMIRAFSTADSSTIQVRTAEWNSSLGVPEQIVLKSGNIVMSLYGTEAFTNYPDLDEFLNYDHAYKISTRSKDWIDVAKAIHATRPGHDSRIHNTRITADIMHGHFNIRTNTKKRLKRKVDFVLGGVVADTSKYKAYQPWFACNSDYIEDIARRGYKDGIMTIKFDDQAKLSEIPKDKPKQMKPVLITYPIKTNKDGAREKYSVFFAVSPKW
ncbi:MAG: hypothetical protein FVQ82_17385 [Planctomycetes bacterium]|nr:hypothetical protein [Planctomycetota bacterium]